MIGPKPSMLGWLAQAAGQMGFKEGATKTASHRMLDRAARGGFGGGGAMGGGLGIGFVGGGLAANFNSSPENRGVGAFLKGGMIGAMGGGLIGSGLSRGAMSKKLGANFANHVKSAGAEMMNAEVGAATQFSHGAWKMARSVESASNRKVAFATGAMLTGGMFGGSHSRAHGFNSKRGNRFSG